MDRRKFIQLATTGLVVSQWPGALFGEWGQTTRRPTEASSPSKGIFDFDDALEYRLHFPLLSIDGTGADAIRRQSTFMPWFESLCSVDGDAPSASAISAIKDLAARDQDVINIYLFGQGTNENIPRLEELAKAARDINAFTVAVIAETESTDLRRWLALGHETGIDSLCLIQTKSLEQNAAILAPGLIDNPLDAACLIALRAYSDLIWNTGMVGIDYVDFKAVVGGCRTSRLSVGSASGPRRAQLAGTKALEGMLLQGTEVGKVHGFWVTIFAGNDFTMEDFDEVSGAIHGAANDRANVIIGMSLGDEFSDRLTVSVLAG